MKEIAIKDDTLLATLVEQEQMTNFTADEITKPFISIAQKEEILDDVTVKPGEFYIPSLGAPGYIGETLEFVVLDHKRAGFIWGSDLGQLEDIIDMTTTKLHYSKEGLNGQKPGFYDDQNRRVLDTHTYAMFLPNHPELGVVLASFKSTGIVAAKVLNTRLMNHSVYKNGKLCRLPVYSYVYTIRSKEGTYGKSSKYYTWNETSIKSLRPITLDDYNIFKVLLGDIEKYTKVNLENIQTTYADFNVEC